MKRDIYQKLTRWKTSSRRKPLILRGARQVGKTYILKDFGSHEYEKIAYFDFEATPDLDDIFKRNLDPSRILTDLSRIQGWEIKPAQLQ
jgi:predicted AAA+ superfamily ATPase